MNGRFRGIFFAHVCMGYSFELRVEVREEIGAKVDIEDYVKVRLGGWVEV